MKKLLKAIIFRKYEFKNIWRKSLYAPIEKSFPKTLLDWFLNNDKKFPYYKYAADFKIKISQNEIANQGEFKIT